MYFNILFNVLVKTVHQIYNFITGIGQNVNSGASLIITIKCKVKVVMLCHSERILIESTHHYCSVSGSGELS